MLKRALLPMLACVLLTGWALAELQTLTTKDGKTYEGAVLKTDDGYVIKTAKRNYTFKDEQVADVTASATQMKEYQRRAGKLGPKDVDGRIELAQWAIDNGLYSLARRQLQGALKIEKDNEKAQLLLDSVKERLTVTSRPDATSQTTDQMIGDADIAKIRLFEVTSGETGLAVEFKNNVLKRFIRYMQGQDEFKRPDFDKKFLSLTPGKQLQYMLTKLDFTDAEFMDDIVIKTDPKFMVEFRKLWPTIASTCAQLACHGAQGGKGDLKFFVAQKNTRADYTNFLILSNWVKNGNLLIDRGDPDRSLLLQFGLNEKLAESKHPVKLTVPVFANRKSPNYRKFVAYIKSLQGSTVPNYRTTYQPPVGKLDSGDSGSGLPDADPDNKATDNAPAENAPVENAPAKGSADNAPADNAPAGGAADNAEPTN